MTVWSGWYSHQEGGEGEGRVVVAVTREKGGQGWVVVVVTRGRGGRRGVFEGGGARRRGRAWFCYRQQWLDTTYTLARSPVVVVFGYCSFEYKRSPHD